MPCQHQFLTHLPLLTPFQSHCSLFSLNVPNTVSVSRHLNYSSVSELVSYIPWETVPGLPLRYQNPQWCSSPYTKWQRTKDTAAPPYPQMPNLCIGGSTVLLPPIRKFFSQMCVCVYMCVHMSVYIHTQIYVKFIISSNNSKNRNSQNAHLGPSEQMNKHQKCCHIAFTKNKADSQLCYKKTTGEGRKVI